MPGTEAGPYGKQTSFFLECVTRRSTGKGPGGGDPLNLRLAKPLFLKSKESYRELARRHLHIDTARGKKTAQIVLETGSS